MHNRLTHQLIGALTLLFIGVSLYRHGPIFTAALFVAIAFNTAVVLLALRALLGGSK